MHIQKKHRERSRISKMTLRHLTSTEISAIRFIATILLAAVAILERINEPVVWAFLGTAIGASIGHLDKK